MPEPINFPAASPRYRLPLLFAGQTQKEFTVNEALALTDALLHPVIEGETNDPPATPETGETWLIGPIPTGTWAGRAGMLACHSAGAWLFAQPREGLLLLDKSAGQYRLLRAGTWAMPALPATPSGGSTVDLQARAAIASILSALQDLAILPE